MSVRSLPAICLLLLAAIHSRAELINSDSIAVDFTKPDEIRGNATWTRPDIVHVTSKGLSFNWDGEVLGKNHTPEADRWKHVCDVTIVTEPVAVGWSWRPVHSVNIRAEVLPPGKHEFRSNSVAFPSGELFARYSPDLVHWSSWQVIKREGQVDSDKPKQMYHGSLGVPASECTSYINLLGEYADKDVAWRSDQEAAVMWILEQQPDFFEKQIPFIGYVQFQFDIGLNGDQTIEQIEFALHYETGGFHTPPRNPETAEERYRTPWRFSAQKPVAKDETQGISLLLNDNHKILRAKSEEGEILWTINVIELCNTSVIREPVFGSVAIEEGHVNISIGESGQAKLDLISGEIEEKAGD